MRKKSTLWVAGVLGIMVGMFGSGSAMALEVLSRSSNPPRLILARGEDKVFELDFVANGGANGISIGNPQILTTTYIKIGDDRQIAFHPLREGSTSVTVRGDDGAIQLILEIDVTSVNLARRMVDLQEAMRPFSKISFRQAGVLIMAEGSLESIEQLEHLRVLITKLGLGSYVVERIKIRR